MEKGKRNMGNDVSWREDKENSEQSQEIFDSEPASLKEIVMERLKEAEDPRNLSSAFDDAESMIKYLNE